MYQLLHSLSSSSIIKTLSIWFNLFGWPSSIRSDGGPQFRGEFSTFCVSHDIKHEVSAPYNPESNGLAEAGVKLVKNILRKCATSGSSADTALYEWSNVPRADGYSPAQLMFGRAQRTSLPSLPGQCAPCLLYTSPSPRDRQKSRMPSSA